MLFLYLNSAGSEVLPTHLNNAKKKKGKVTLVLYFSLNPSLPT